MDDQTPYPTVSDRIPSIVSLYRILVSYPCIVSFLYEYVLRSHRIVGYQYTYKIQKIYNFSGIQLNTHLMDTTEYSPVSSNMSIHQRYEELNTYS
jgi:hypothetical protein